MRAHRPVMGQQNVGLIGEEHEAGLRRVRPHAADAATTAATRLRLRRHPPQQCAGVRRPRCAPRSSVQRARKRSTGLIASVCESRARHARRRGCRADVDGNQVVAERANRLRTRPRARAGRDAAASASTKSHPRRAAQATRDRCGIPRGGRGPRPDPGSMPEYGVKRARLKHRHARVGRRRPAEIAHDFNMGVAATEQQQPLQDFLGIMSQAVFRSLLDCRSWFDSDEVGSRAGSIWSSDPTRTCDLRDGWHAGRRLLTYRRIGSKKPTV